MMKPRDVPGHMEIAHLKILRRLVNNLKAKGPIVELGSYKGRSAATLGLAAKQLGRKLHCIDPWQPYLDKKFMPMEDIYKQFQGNMLAVGLTVDADFYCHRMTSTDAIPLIKSASMVFVDASHQYEDVKIDFENWLPKVKTGGIFAAHDYGDSYRPGPTKAWEEIVKPHPNVKNISRNGNLIWAFI
jgi:predicted O-methyltransferase YrrM